MLEKGKRTESNPLELVCHGLGDSSTASQRPTTKTLIFIPSKLAAIIGQPNPPMPRYDLQILNCLNVGEAGCSKCSITLCSFIKSQPSSNLKVLGCLA